MRTLRRFLSIALGLFAGAAAWKLLADYERSNHIEGEFVELPDPPEGEPPQGGHGADH